MQEIYVSTDIETNGPIVGKHSMLSFASVALLADKTILGIFEANLELLAGAEAHPETMQFWNEHPSEWAECRKNLQCPEIAIKQYVEWVKSLPGEAIFVAYPIGFDFTFINWYMLQFAHENPFERRMIDIKSYAMAVLKRPFSQCSKDYLPQHWFDQVPRKHVALDDAMVQGLLFCNILNDNLKDAGPLGVILAAGGLLWRHSARGDEIAIVYRPKYHDWSLPKGWVEKGESCQEAALREVEEETCCKAHLRRFVGCTCYQVNGIPKVVLFWEVELTDEGEFVSDGEVDVLRWCSRSEALNLLTHEGERRLLISF